MILLGVGKIFLKRICVTELPVGETSFSFIRSKEHKFKKQVQLSCLTNFKAKNEFLCQVKGSPQNLNFCNTKNKDRSPANFAQLILREFLLASNN